MYCPFFLNQSTAVLCRKKAQTRPSPPNPPEGIRGGNRKKKLFKTYFLTYLLPEWKESWEPHSEAPEQSERLLKAPSVVHYF